MWAQVQMYTYSKFRCRYNRGIILIMKIVSNKHAYAGIDADVEEDSHVDVRARVCGRRSSATLPDDTFDMRAPSEVSAPK